MGQLALAYQNEPYYFFTAILGSVIFLIQLILMITTGAGAEGAEGADGAFDGIDLETDMSSAEAVDAVDAGHIDSTAAFKLFSVQSILGFLMGFGWMGLACRLEWEMSGFASFAASMGFGTLAMGLSAFLQLQLKKLNTTSKQDVRTTLGQVGTVYLKIPAKGMGMGQIEITISGTKRILKATSNGGEIASFTTVEVIDVHNDNTVLVKPKV